MKTREAGNGRLDAVVIPSERSESRNRSHPGRGLSAGTIAIPRLRARFACASLGMTLFAASLAAQQPAAAPNAQQPAQTLDLTAVSLPIPAAGKLVAITIGSVTVAMWRWLTVPGQPNWIA